MLNLNFKSITISLCVVLASCQSVEEPKPSVITPTIEKPIVEKEAVTKKEDDISDINLAIKYIKNNELTIAKDILKNYLEKNNDNRAKLNLALVYMKVHEPHEAKKLLLSIQKVDTNNSIVYEHLAIIARQEGQFQQSKKLYLQALDNSDKPSIHLNYAILLDLYLNDLVTALEHYTIYQQSGLAQQDGIELEKWMADLKVRLKRSN